MSVRALCLTIASVYWLAVYLVAVAFVEVSESASPRSPAADMAEASVARSEVVDQQDSSFASLLLLPEVRPAPGEPSAYFWKADPGEPPHTAVCPAGWVCTLTMSGVDGVIVAVGDNTWYRIWEGTFRRLADRAQGPLVGAQLPCGLVEQEEIRLARQVRPSNFTCPTGGG